MECARIFTFHYNWSKKIIFYSILGTLLFVGVLSFIFWQPSNIPKAQVASETTVSEMNNKQEKTLSSTDDLLKNKNVLDFQPFQLETPNGKVEKRRLTASDEMEINQMLSALSPITAKSEQQIIRILLSFYPEDYRADGLYAIFAQMYKEYDPDATVEEKVRRMVKFIQQNLARERRLKEDVQAAIQIKAELKRSDPIKYYDTEIQNEKDSIPIT